MQISFLDRCAHPQIPDEDRTLVGVVTKKYFEDKIGKELDD